MILTSFFAEDGPAIHMSAKGVLHIGGLDISNSILYGWICAVAICALLVYVARKATVRPRGGLVQFVEAGTDFITNLVEGAFDNPKRGRKYVPFFVTLFFFILLNNWFGLIPGVGEAIRSGENPLLRPLTADLNGTLAIGIFAMAVVYGASVRELGGFKKYLRHFFVGSPRNPLYLVIGILEMLTGLTRVLSLSLRLFLNVTIGEIVIAVFAYLGHMAAPLTTLPFTLVELFVGALQAYIFTLLTLMYLAIAANHVHEDHAATDHEVPNLIQSSTLETIEPKASGA